MKTKKCYYCGKIFTDKHNKCSEEGWIKRKYCSKKCADLAKKGKRYSPDTEFKKGENCGEAHRLWKGDEVGIKSVHSWVKRHKGLLKKCSQCGVSAKERTIDWANKDHSYKRNLDDYVALCRSCHRKYDIQFNNYYSHRWG